MSLCTHRVPLIMMDQFSKGLDELSLFHFNYRSHVFLPSLTNSAVISRISKRGHSRAILRHFAY